jgi:hypothetical protein
VRLFYDPTAVLTPGVGAKDCARLAEPALVELALLDGELTLCLGT